MAKKKKIAYWALFVFMLYMAVTVMSVGETQARYVNTATWYTVVEPTRNGVTSDCLTPVNQPPVTVLLGQMALESREISFTLESGANTSGELKWNVDCPDYLDVRLQIGDAVLSSGDTVSLTEGTPVTVMMHLGPTEKAAEPRDGLHVNIQINFGNILSGSFRVELMKVAEPEVTEPEVTEPEVTEPEVTEPEVTEPETTGTEQMEPSATIMLESPHTYHPECVMPLRITSDKATRIFLNPASQDSVQDFPRGTRFSLDQGASWFMLYQAGTIPVDLAAAEMQTVLLDLTRTVLATQPSLTITADSGEAVTLTANTDPLCWTTTRVLTQDTQIELTLAEPWENCQWTYDMEMLTVTEEGKTYTPADLSADSLIVELSGQQLRVRTGDTLPQPGTYRVNLRWVDQGICVGQTQMIFFINYGINQYAQRTGGAQQ